MYIWPEKRTRATEVILNSQSSDLWSGLQAKQMPMQQNMKATNASTPTTTNAMAQSGKLTAINTSETKVNN